METLKIVKRFLDLEIGEEKFKLKYPSAFTMNEYLERINNGEVSEFKMTCELLEKCGLPIDAIKENDLELIDLQNIITKLVQPKKN